MRPTDDLSSLILGCKVFPLLDNALLMLEEKVTRLERGYKNYLFVSTACGLILSQECPEQSEHQKFEAIERATRLYTKILNSTGELSESNMLGNEPTQVLLPTSVSVRYMTEHSQPPAIGLGVLTPPGPTYLMINLPEVRRLDFHAFGVIADCSIDDRPGEEYAFRAVRLRRHVRLASR
jgi:hypothetical protein